MDEKASYELSFIYESPPITFPANNLISQVYVISKNWWDSWCRFSGYNSDRSGNRPGMIINAWIDFKNPDPESYVFLSKNTWRRLKNWYNVDMKKVLFIVDGFPDYNIIDTLVSITGQGTKKISTPIWFTFDKYEQRVKKKFKATNNPCKFYIKYEESEMLIEERRKKLSELNFFDEIQIKVSVTGKIEDKTVRFAEGPERYDEDEDLKRALEMSMQPNVEAKPAEVDAEKIENVKESLRTQSSYIDLQVLPLKKLQENIQGILASISSK